MTEIIQKFVLYMKEVRKTSDNTVLSYERDLKKMNQYFAEQGIQKAGQITDTALNSYILFLESQGRKPSTIFSVFTERRIYKTKYSRRLEGAQSGTQSAHCTIRGRDDAAFRTGGRGFPQRTA